MTDLIGGALAVCVGCGIGQYIAYTMDLTSKERALSVFEGTCIGIVCLTISLIMGRGY